MDKNAIKKYAVWAREQLIEKVTARAVKYEIIDGQEIDDTLETIGGEVLSETERKQRKALIQRIRAEGYSQVIEEVAYTWFNRFVAIRFMEVNGYLPSHVRVFSDESGAFNPQILSEAIHMDLAGLDINKVMQYKEDADEEELFRYLLKIQCNALNEILPQMFQKIEDYTELLLPDYLLREGSVIEKLVNEIPEDNFDVNTETGQVEVIGWMYQYYISAKHDEVVDPLHGKVVKKEEVPAATQLFTTDWVVRYLIDNSVGRYWIERNPESKLADELTYYVKPKDGVVKYVNEKITPQDVTVFDPCVGSGHFLVYAFDVLMKIYVEYGYSERDAAAEIVNNNLFGIDIDGRAAQLAYFAVMMKARQYDRRFFTKNIQPVVYEITESNNADQSSIEYFCGDNEVLKKDVEAVLDVLVDAKEYGSILRMPDVDYEKINERFVQIDNEINMYKGYLLGDFMALVRSAEIMSGKYAIVATNPPYLNKYDSNLKKYITENYSEYKGDLFSVFMVHNYDFCLDDGYTVFMTPMVWMFIKTYENLRKLIISEKQLVTLIQFEYSAFEEATVPICSFVTKNGMANEEGQYFRLSEFRGGMDVQRDRILEALADEECDYFYSVHQSNFEMVPGRTIAYWISDTLLEDFAIGESLKVKGDTRQGMATSDNNRFLRLWHEVDYSKLGLDCASAEEASSTGKKWFPYNKGGEFRKWYGNIDYTINYENDGQEVKEYATSLYKTPTRTIKSMSEYFKPCLSWSKISSGSIAFRYYPKGFIFDVAGCCIFYNDENDMFYDFGFINSKIAKSILAAISPTLNYEAGHIASLPVIRKQEYYDRIIELTKTNVSLSKEDWDSYETSWDFAVHPFIQDVSRIEEAYENWEKKCKERFDEVKSNEEQINQYFIEIYKLNNEMNPQLEQKDITVRLAEKQREIKSFISYAVGCMFGRYSLDAPGIVYAGGEWNPSFYSKFQVDQDGIIPICDDEYFPDDIVGRFIDFVQTVYGEDTLEENLQYISNILGGNGSPREVIRNYFNNEFYSDHVKMYQKRPIYWLFDSGKKNGFKCLVYVHRYKADTIARIRTDYLHEQQARYRTAIEDIAGRIDVAASSEKVKLSKRLNTLKAQDEELHAYEEKIHHLADQMISIDLDDGVKNNYEKFKSVLAKIK